MTAALKTGLTLLGLVLMLFAGVSWGFDQVSKPFPKKPDAPLCIDTSYAAGDTLSPAKVTVSVLNASGREGLAGRTMQLLTQNGFARGQTANAPEGTTVAAPAEIWVTDRKNPAVQLVRSWLGKVPVRVRSELPSAGIDVVVGDQFAELTQGLASVTVKDDAVVCSPELE